MGNKNFRMGIVYADGVDYGPIDFSDESDNEPIQNELADKISLKYNEDTLTYQNDSKIDKEDKLEKEASKLYKKGKKAEKKGNLEKAKKYYNKACKKSKINYEKYAERLEDLKDSIKIENQAYALYKQGKDAEKREEFYEAISLYKAAYDKSRIMQNYKKYKKRIKELELKIEKDYYEEIEMGINQSKAIQKPNIGEWCSSSNIDEFIEPGDQKEVKTGRIRGNLHMKSRHNQILIYKNNDVKNLGCGISKVTYEVYNMVQIADPAEEMIQKLIFGDCQRIEDQFEYKVNGVVISEAEANRIISEAEAKDSSAKNIKALIKTAKNLEQEAAALHGMYKIEKLTEAIKHYEQAIKLDTQQKEVYENKKIELEEQEFKAIINYIELNNQLMHSATNNLNKAQRGQIGGAKIKNIIKYYKSVYEKCQQSINLGNAEDSKIYTLQSIARSGKKIYSLFSEWRETKDLNNLNQVIEEIKDFNKLLQENPSLQIPGFLQGMEEVMVKLEEEKTSFEESNAEDNTNISFEESNAEDNTNNIDHSGLYPESENISYETNNQQREIGHSIGLHQNIMSIRGVDKYYLDGLNNILKLRILKNHNIDQYNIEIIEAQEVNNNFDAVSLQKIYLSLMKAFTKKNDFILLPIVINFPDKSSMSHAVGIVIKRNFQEVKIKYFDSENQKINPKLKLSIIEIVETINHDIERSVFFEQIGVEQQQAENCGYEVIENFFNEVFNNRATQNDAILVHNLVYGNSLLDPESSMNQISENDRIIKILSNQTCKINKFIVNLDSDFKDELLSINEVNECLQDMSCNLATTHSISLNSLGEVELSLLNELEHDKDKAKQVLVNLPEYSARVIAEYLGYSETELSNIRSKENVNIPYTNDLNYIDETSPENKKMIQEMFRFNEQFIYNLNFEYNSETSDDLINSGNQLFSEEIYNAEYQYNYNLVCVVGALALLNKHIF